MPALQKKEQWLETGRWAGPGEKVTVRLEVPYERLALVNRDLETVVEAGEFKVMVGNSSRDDDLLKDRFEVKA